MYASKWVCVCAYFILALTFLFRSDSVVKSWDIAMKNAEEFNIPTLPKATVRSISQGPNVRETYLLLFYTMITQTILCVYA